MTTKTDEQERAKFEKAMRMGGYKNFHLIDDSFKDPEIDAAWLGWKLHALQKQPISVDALAQEIRRVDGQHTLGAGALAEALMPFIQNALQSQDREDAADPLQGAADWLSKATPNMQAVQLAGLLLIGFNRAERLLAHARRRIEGEGK